MGFYDNIGTHIHNGDNHIFKDYPIGDLFIVNNSTYTDYKILCEVVRDDIGFNRCRKCIYNLLNRCDQAPDCRSIDRKDKTSVYFKATQIMLDE